MKKKCFVSNFFPSGSKQANKTPQFVTSNEIYWEDEITNLTEDFGTEGLSPREGKTREAPSTSRRKWLKVQARLLQNLEATKTSFLSLGQAFLLHAGTTERHFQDKADLLLLSRQLPLDLLVTLSPSES